MRSSCFSRSAIACAVLALAACASLAPPYERPPAPVASTFPNAEAAAGGTVPAAELPWQDYFVDGRLQQLIALALDTNRDLRAAVLNLETASAAIQARRADLYPTIGVGATGLRQPGLGGGTTSLYTAGLALSSYELDFFGRIRSLTNAAAAQYLATVEARKATQIALIASVATLHFALGADEALLALTERTLASRVESARLTQLRFDNGVASELDLRLAESLVEAARVALSQQRRQRELDQNALVLLVGQPLSAALAAVAPFDTQSLADLPAGLPSEVLLRRPDVRQAEQELIAANANIGAARAAFWPSITLTASAGVASTELSRLFSNGGAWSFAPQLFQPIFDAGRNRANLRIAEGRREIAVAQYERAIQAAFRDVADALAGRATLDEQLRAVHAQAQAEQGRFKLSELRFESGVSSSLELLDAQRSLFGAQQAVVQTQLALLQNRVALYRALGGGWTESAAQ